MRFGAALTLALLLGAAPAVAQTAPRAAAQDGFGRMVFDWEGPVEFSAEVSGNDLVVRFNRPLTGNPRSVVGVLAGYVRDAQVSGDGRTVTFALTRPAQARSFLVGRSVVVDILPRAAASTPVVAPPPAAPAPTAQPAAAPPARAASDGVITVRGGDHTGYHRIVFDWPRSVDYQVDSKESRAAITFARRAKLDTSELIHSLPPDVSVVGVDSKDDSVTLVIALPPKARLRHFTSGSKVVVDVVRPADSDAPKAAQNERKQAPVPLAPPPGSEIAAPSVAPSKPQPAAPKTPAQVIEEMRAAAKAKSEQDAAARAEQEAKAKAAQEAKDAKAQEAREAKEAKAQDAKEAKEAKAAQAAQAAQEAKDAKAAQATQAAQAAQEAKDAKTAQAAQAAQAAKDAKGKPPQQVASPPPSAPATASLAFAWTHPAAAAVFRRAGWTWVVFDRNLDVDVAKLATAAGPLAASIERLPGKEVTALRMITPPDIAPSVRRDGLMWIVDLARQDGRAATPLEVQRQENAGEVSLFVPVAEGGASFAITDPEVGDIMQVIPVVPLGSGINPGRSLPDADLLPTTQGVVVVPRADGVSVRSSRAGVTISAPGGLQMSKASEGHAATLRLGDAPAAGPLMDMAGWLGGGAQKFKERRERLEEQLDATPLVERNPARLDLARLQVANGNAAEALSILRVISDTEPTAVDNPAFRAVRGAAQFLMGRFGEAIEDLSVPGLDKVAEAGFWRAAAQSAMGDPARQAPLLSAGLGLLKDYSQPLKTNLGFLAAESLLAARDDKAGNELLRMLKDQRLSKARQGQWSFLEGEKHEIGGAYDDALLSWLDAEQGGSRLYRALAAIARVETELKLQRIKPREAVERLEKLRFAWRGDDFEVDLLHRLGSLRLSLGDFGEGLRTYRQLLSTFPTNKIAPEITKEMAATFERLFLGGGADSLPPITAIALFDEFQELTPSGEKGDEMIRKLADRLVAVDLLDRAADLLNHQVDFRLQGVEKARVGTRLAIVDLLNRKPEDALAALKKSEMPNLPAEVVTQRRHLTAQVLHDMGRGREALVKLEGDDSANARLLRAEIVWKLQDWQEAARAFADLVVQPEPGKALDSDSARFVLHWATALTLGNDDAGVARLRKSYKELMAKSPYRDAFTLLTADTHSSLADYQKVADKIKEAEKFQAFLSAYRARLRAEGLSAIN